MKTNRVLIKGAGDLASGVALRLHRAGYLVAMTDLAEPTAIRWTVSFCPAILQGTAMVEDVRGRLAKGEADALAAWAAGEIPVFVDPQAACRSFIQPQVLVDAILAKRNLGTSIQDAPAVIALGPGFTAGVDCHAVVETMRGHNLGRVYYQGSALPNTGVRERSAASPRNGSCMRRPGAPSGRSTRSATGWKPGRPLPRWTACR